MEEVIVRLKPLGSPIADLGYDPAVQAHSWIAKVNQAGFLFML